MGAKVVARLIVCMTLLGLTGCVGPTVGPIITARPGPLYVVLAPARSGVPVPIVVIGIAAAGRRAGGPCLQGPVCLIPR